MAQGADACYSNVRNAGSGSGRCATLWNASIAIENDQISFTTEDPTLIDGLDAQPVQPHSEPLP
jgi:hypothetical protein